MSLFVGNISRNLRPRDLEDEFSRFGRNRLDNKGSYAFCEFDDERDAEDAISAMHGKDFDGCKMTVEWGKRSNRYDPSTSRAGRLSDVRCYSCGEPGHFSRQCTKGRGGYDRYGGGDRYGDRGGRDRNRDRSRSRSRDRRRRSYSDDDRDRRDRGRDRRDRGDSRDRRDHATSRDRRDRDDSRDRRDRDDSRERRYRDDSRGRRDRADSRDEKRDASRDSRDPADSKRDSDKDENGIAKETENSPASPVVQDSEPAAIDVGSTEAEALEPSKMKVSELRDELAKRGLDQKGLKGELCARLEDALAK